MGLATLFLLTVALFYVSISNIVYGEPTCPYATEITIKTTGGGPPSINYDYKQENVIVCEGKNVILQCTDADKIVKIVKAFYGRIESGDLICPDPALRPITPATNCTASEATQISSVLCTGKNICQLEASNKVFGDPCPGIYKYFKVRFNCA